MTCLDSKHQMSNMNKKDVDLHEFGEKEEIGEEERARRYRQRSGGSGRITRVDNRWKALLEIFPTSYNMLRTNFGA